MQTERRPFSLKWPDGAVYVHLGQRDPAKTHGMLGSYIRYFDVMSWSISWDTTHIAEVKYSALLVHILDRCASYKLPSGMPCIVWI
jgi:hypothetical protein